MELSNNKNGISISKEICPINSLPHGKIEEKTGSKVPKCHSSHNSQIGVKGKYVNITSTMIESTEVAINVSVNLERPLIGKACGESLIFASIRYNVWESVLIVVDYNN